MLLGNGTGDRNPSYDGVRAFAVLLVMGGHANIGLLYGSGLGVDIFFALSGFLITTLLLTELGRTGGIALGRFYARRAYRLLPALFLLAALTTAYSLLFAPDWLRTENLRALPPVLLYYANWAAVEGAPLGFYGHTWSLAIEEQFYVVWPLLVLALTWRAPRSRKLVVGCAVGVVGALLLRVVLWDGPESVMRLYNGIDTRADSLLAGCFVAALLFRARESRRVARVMTTAGWLGVAFIFVTLARSAIDPTGPEAWHAGFTWGLSAVALSAAAVVGLLTVAPKGPLARLLGTPTMADIGRISYGLYLFHPAVYWIVDHHFGAMPFYPRVVLKFVVTFALATASYRFVEEPFLRRKQRLRTVQLDDGPVPASSAPPASAAA